MKPYVIFVSLLFPAISVAQSAVSQYSSVVSVRELAMAPKAARALEKGTQWPSIARSSGWTAAFLSSELPTAWKSQLTLRPHESAALHFSLSNKQET
jgi:hypothetical protein